MNLFYKILVWYIGIGMAINITTYAVVWGIFKFKFKINVFAKLKELLF